MDGTGPRVRRNDYGGLSPPGLSAWRPTRSVSVIIPAYNCQADLDLALAALSCQTYPAELLEVVVVDDGSLPPLALPEIRPQRCRLLRVPARSAGWGRANALHTGAASAEGEILHWLDADLVPFPEHVEAQARWQHISPDAVTMGHKRFVRDLRTTVAEVLVRSADGTLDSLFPPGASDPHDYVEDLLATTRQLRAADHLAFRAHVGATAAVGRELYHAAGGVDRSLRLGEDSELGYRLAQAGAVFVPEPAARSWHLGPSSMMRNGDALRRYNRPFLADRMALPRWLRQDGRRTWAVPLLTAVVSIADDTPLDLACACVDRLLASDDGDLRVVLVADWGALQHQPRSVLADPLLERRLLAATYGSDARVRLVTPASPDGDLAGPGEGWPGNDYPAFPSPYLLSVPVHLGVSPATVRRAVAELDAARLGLLRLVPPGVATSTIDLWRTAAVSRARRYRRAREPLAEVVAEVWGAGWASGGFGLVDLAAPKPARTAIPVARPVPVAGMRSWLRATGYVGRIAAGQARHRTARLGLWPVMPAIIPAMSMLQAVRRRVRLRTRLRRTREAWRQAFPARLPEWSVPEPGPPSPPPAFPDGAATVDATAANPQGREQYGPRLPTGRLVVAADGAGAVRWSVVRLPDRTTVVRGRVGDRLDTRQAAVLAGWGVVTAEVPPDPALPAAAYAHLLAELAMTGVLVIAPAGLPEAVAERLAPELVAVMTASLPDRRADSMEWEIRSVQQRRVALQQHAAGLRRPLVSVLLATKRPHLVAPAVAALAAQTYPEFEIVVARHGHDGPPPDRPAAGRPVRFVPVPAERNLGEALAAAAAAASGELVTKVDDDDRYGPEHLWDLVLAHHFSGATVVGKGAELVYLAPKDLTVRRRMAAETFTDTVAGGTMLLGRDDLAAAGGWPAVPRWVDRALLDRVLGDGGRVYRTHPLGFIYTRHEHGHTWEADLDYFVHDARRRWRGLPPYPEFGTA